MAAASQSDGDGALPPVVKSRHAEVNYHLTNGPDRCNACVHYIPPRSCESVQSPVLPQGWCIRFTRKRKG